MTQLYSVHHHDGVPGTTIEEAAVGAFAEALLAPDAKNGVNLDAAKRRMIFIRHPEHAIFHWAIFHAGGRTCASSAALGDHCQLLRLLLAWSGDSFGPGLELEFVGNHADGFGGAGLSRHGGDYTSKIGPRGSPFGIRLRRFADQLGPGLLSHDVIPNARAFTSGRRDLARA